MNVVWLCLSACSVVIVVGSMSCMWGGVTCLCRMTLWFTVYSCGLTGNELLFISCIVRWSFIQRRNHHQQHHAMRIQPADTHCSPTAMYCHSIRPQNGGAYYGTSSSVAVIGNSTFTGNTAANGEGADIYLDGAAKLDLTCPDNTFTSTGTLSWTASAIVKRRCPAGTDGSSAAKIMATPADIKSFPCSTACPPCTPGHVSSHFDTKCDTCAAGTYVAETGQSVCSLCSAGAYQSETGKATCPGCAVGTFQTETGKPSCVTNTCAAGTHFSSGPSVAQT
jgi:hypothetical protein